MQYPSYDLQTAYHTIFHRGFVYALWVGWAAIMPELNSVLELAYQQWLGYQEKLLTEAAERFGFDRYFTEEYLTRTIAYRLTPERQTDLEFFAHRLEEL
jgi:predicted solute-binding protein